MRGWHKTKAQSFKAVVVMRVIADSKANIIERAIIDILSLDNNNVV